MEKSILLPLLFLVLISACTPDRQESAELESTEEMMVHKDAYGGYAEGEPVSAPPAPMIMADRSGDIDFEALPVPGDGGGPANYANVSQPTATPYDTVAKQIIKTATLVYEVKKLQESNHKVDSLVKRMGGYISSSNQNNSRERHEINLVLRVPSRHFDGLMKALSSLPERIDHKSVEAQDVTEQYVDLKSRLQTKKKVEKRYQELLQKANTVKEILEVEEKLRQLQEEIEAKEGQLRYLSHQVGYSTINLNLYEVQKYEYLPAKSPHFGQRLLGAMDSGWQLLLGVVLGIFHLWPLWLLAIAVVAGIRSYRRRKAKRNII